VQFNPKFVENQSMTPPDVPLADESKGEKVQIQCVTSGG
jgi:hypothetical protein